MSESNVTTLDKVRIERAVSRNEPCLETVISALEQALTELKNGDTYANKCLDYTS
jgi:exonuclease VII small subunit